MARVHRLVAVSNWRIVQVTECLEAKAVIWGNSAYLLPNLLCQSFVSAAKDLFLFARSGRPVGAFATVNVLLFLLSRFQDLVSNQPGS